MIETLAACFEKQFGSKRPRFARAPGRVNLIGEHTDYNEGFVLPVAIDRYVTVAYASNPDNISTLCGYSIDFEQSCSAPYGELGPVSSAPSWFDYAAGMAWALGREKADLPGLDFVVAGNVPIGAGLSSSAALELAMARALFDVSGMRWDGRLAARLGQRVENDYIGLESGIMDQMASSLSECGAAMLLDCRDLTIETVPLPEELAVVVLDTGTRRELATSAYNERRASCEAAVAAVRRQAASTRALRDVSVELLDAARSTMDETTYRRALHVIRENERTLEMARALRRGDIESLDVLMADSHESLRELYEVSSPELDRVVGHARSHPGCRGARMTGAGFGGCAVALVDTEQESSFAAELRAATAALYTCQAVSGAEILDE